MQAPLSPARLHEEIAGADQAFLVGERDVRTAIDGRERRLQPAAPTHAAITQSAGRAGGLDDGALACAAFGARAGQRFFNSPSARGIGDRREAGANSARVRPAPATLLLAVERLDAVAIARAANEVHRAVADRAGGAEHRHAAHGASGGLVVTQWNCAHSSPNDKTAADAIGAARRKPKIAAATTAATNPSRRSRSPPWPGMTWLESLTPNRRFTADSNRSPSWEITDRSAAKASNGPVFPAPKAATAEPPQGYDEGRQSRPPRSFSG